jgi:hypothetical protein
MVTVPLATPVTTPLELIEAIAELLLLHVPPLTASVNVVVKPLQTVAAPLIVPALADVDTVTA